jgi:hypothetical protein
VNEPVNSTTIPCQYNSLPVPVLSNLILILIRNTSASFLRESSLDGIRTSHDQTRLSLCLRILRADDTFIRQGTSIATHPISVVVRCLLQP